jgi:hypothetical protein
MMCSTLRIDQFLTLRLLGGKSFADTQNIELFKVIFSCLDECGHSITY